MAINVKKMITFKDIAEIRSRMYVGMKMKIPRFSTWFEEKQKIYVTVCELYKEFFVVKWYGAMGNELRECFKYVALIFGDNGFEVA